MICKLSALFGEQFDTFIEFRTVKNAWSANGNFYTVLLQIYSGNCLQKIGILDLSLIKLLQNEQGCIFCLTVNTE